VGLTQRYATNTVQDQRRICLLIIMLGKEGTLFSGVAKWFGVRGK